MSKIHLKTALAFAGLVSLTAGLSAAEAADCANAQSTVEINSCFDKEYQAADKALNAAYATALTYVRERKLDIPYDAKSFETSLKSAQRAWIEYRDADCKNLVAQQWTGGTGTTSAILQCMIEKTTERTKELKALTTEQ